MTRAIAVQTLVAGEVEAPLLVLAAALSFWGGLNPETAEIIDTQHPDCGTVVKGCCLVIPGIRGSTAAPGALLECIASGNGPAAIVLAEADPTPLISSLVAVFIGLPAMPVALLSQARDIHSLESGATVRLCDESLTVLDRHPKS